MTEQASRHRYLVYLISALTLMFVFFTHVGETAEDTTMFAVSANKKQIEKIEKEIALISSEQPDPSKLSTEKRQRLKRLQDNIQLLLQQNNLYINNLEKKQAQAESLAPTQTIPLEEVVKEEPRASEWIKMQVYEKENYVYQGFGALEQQGVVLMETPQYYVEALDRKISTSPAIGDTYMDYLLVQAIYDHESQAREGLRRIASRYVDSSKINQET